MGFVLDVLVVVKDKSDSSTSKKKAKDSSGSVEDGNIDEE